MNVTPSKIFNSFIASGACLLLLLSVNTAFAQNSGTTRTNRPLQSMTSPDQQEMQMREWNLTHVSEEVSSHFKKDMVSLFPQIKDDFTHIQIVNNEMMQTVFVKKQMDYKLIQETTAEIRKRAARLKQNLVLPKVEAKKSREESSDELTEDKIKQSLLLLDRSVMSFVTNPIFKQPNVVEPDKITRARDDLENIIQFSDAIRKGADSHLKTSTPRH